MLPEDKLAGLAMRLCRPDQMHRGLADHAGKVALVVAAPPPYEAGGPAADIGSRGCPACRADQGVLSEQRLGSFLSAAWRVLRPGGHLAVITTARHVRSVRVRGGITTNRTCAGYPFGDVYRIAVGWYSTIIALTWAPSVAALFLDF